MGDGIFANSDVYRCFITPFLICRELWPITDIACLSVVVDRPQEAWLCSSGTLLLRSLLHLRYQAVQGKLLFVLIPLPYWFN